MTHFVYKLVPPRPTFGPGDMSDDEAAIMGRHGAYWSGLLADGTAVRLGGPRLKDVAGLSLTKLFVGSEGTLGIVTSLIGETGANIDNLAFITNSPDFNDILIDLDVYDLKHLTTLISRLREQPVVSRVERIYG